METLEPPFVGGALDKCYRLCRKFSEFRFLPTASEGLGKVMFSVCSHPRGGGYLPRSGEYLPWLGEGCLP